MWKGNGRPGEIQVMQLRLQSSTKHTFFIYLPHSILPDKFHAELYSSLFLMQNHENI